MKIEICKNCGQNSHKIVLLCGNITCLPCANEIGNDEQGEREFMRAEANERKLSEDERYIYGM